MSLLWMIGGADERSRLLGGRPDWGPQVQILYHPRAWAFDRGVHAMQFPVLEVSEWIACGL